MKILIGICGGVAAYKVLDVASSLRKRGHEVTVAMTAAATRFVTPLSFTAVSGNPTLTELFPAHLSCHAEATYPHLYPATQADLFLLAPATAHTMGKIACGLGDDVVSTSALSLPETCLRFFAPSMNVEMWEQACVRQNVARMEAAGWTRIGPVSGHLACGMTGMGRMAEPADILAAMEEALAVRQDWNGRRVLILSGPTHEYMDPVRYIGNASSGKMGLAIAKEALACGAEVDFVTGPVNDAQIPKHPRAQIWRITSAQELLETARPLFPKADIVIYAAAVADYTPVKAAEEKRPKTEGGFLLQLQSTPDVAASLSRDKRPDQVVIGFALQTDEGEEAARAKLKKKNLDGIVLNWAEAMGAEEAAYRFLLTEDSSFQDWGRIGKREAASRLLAAAIQQWNQRNEKGTT